jgi:tetraacyldisaccharide 4'-kinase
VALVTGIASPEPLLHHLTAIGIKVLHYEFEDHHDFTEKDIQKFSGHDLVLTTEKDFVRMEGKVRNLFYLEVSHHFTPEDHTELEKSIKGLLH